MIRVEWPFYYRSLWPCSPPPVVEEWKRGFSSSSAGLAPDACFPCRPPQMMTRCCPPRPSSSIPAAATILRRNPFPALLKDLSLCPSRPSSSNPAAATILRRSPVFGQRRRKYRKGSLGTHSSSFFRKGAH